MNSYKSFVQRHGMRLLVLVLLVGLCGLARLPEVYDAERALLASQFKFTEVQLPTISGPFPLARVVRAVHPSFERISAWISSVGASVALNDLDGDGLPNDVCYVDSRTDQVVVEPVPGTGARYESFGLDPAPVSYDPATMAPMGCLPGDVNEDGLRDIVVYYWGRTPIVFIRRQEERTSTWQLRSQSYVRQELVPGNERWFSNACTFSDLDGDGHMDLIIGNYFQDGAHVLDANGTGKEEMQDSMSRAYNGGKKHFLLWVGGTAGSRPAVHFTEVSAVLDDEVNHGWTLAIGAADLDGDLLPEIYLANDFGPDRLLHNRSTPGHLSFAIVEGEKTWLSPNSKVLGRDSFKGMGVDFADLNGDGILDIFVSNIAQEYALQESHFVFLSTGRLDLMQEGIAPYVDRSESLGLSRSYWSWDARLADFNNDGVFEAMQATGFVKGTVNRWPELHETAMGNDERLQDPGSWHRFQPGDDLSGHQPNPFFVQGSNGRFYDLSKEIGIDDPQVSRGIAIADVDGDGRLDFAIANQWEPSKFYHNQSPKVGEYLGLHLLLPAQGETLPRTLVHDGHPVAGTHGRPAIGASVIVSLPDGRHLIGQVDGGNGHSGKRSPELHFGLGQVSHETPVQVDVNWRGTEGLVHHERLHLSPEWHTVQLGSATVKQEE